MRKIALIGGDCRQIHAAATLKKAGFTPFVYGNDGAASQGFTAPYTLKETISDAEAVLLPVPTEKKEGYLFAPLFEKSIKTAELAENLPKNCTVFLWGAKNNGIFKETRIVDLSKDEICLRQNARATAEAALMLALQKGEKALFCTRAAIVGYGRIGQFLAKQLLSLGAQVRVGARREDSRKAAEIVGCSAFSTDDPALFSNVDLIFNTVPSQILGKKVLQDVPKDALFLELASAPGGLSLEKPPFFVLKAPGLPGKFCPKSAGEFLAEAVIRHLCPQKEGVIW